MPFVADPDEEDVAIKVMEVPEVNANVEESTVVAEVLPEVLIMLHVP